MTSGTPLRKVRTEPNGYVRRRKPASITHSEEVDATGQARYATTGQISMAAYSRGLSGLLTLA